MSSDRELMQQALDALEYEADLPGLHSEAKVWAAIKALRARLAQPEQKPVAWMYRGNLHEFNPSDWAKSEVISLYTAPLPHKEWQGLTDEEFAAAWAQSKGEVLLRLAPFARAIEAKLRAKNAKASED